MTFNEFKKAGYSIQRIVREYVIQDMELDQTNNIKEVINSSDYDTKDTDIDSAYTGFDIFDPEGDLIFSVDSEELDDLEMALNDFITELS